MEMDNFTRKGKWILKRDEQFYLLSWLVGGLLMSWRKFFLGWFLIQSSKTCQGNDKHHNIDTKETCMSCMTILVNLCSLRTLYLPAFVTWLFNGCISSGSIPNHSVDPPVWPCLSVAPSPSIWFFFPQSQLAFYIQFIDARETIWTILSSYLLSYWFSLWVIH